VWDYADLPEEGMYFGRSAGSAQPLVWAHAEYLKLLRSVTDGKVFDIISVVADRYAVPADKRTFSNKLEVFQTGRPISAMLQGRTLRIMDQNPFRVVYTTDNWATKLAVDSRMVGRPGSFVDILTAAPSPDHAGQQGSIVFTLFWPQENRWLGRNCEVTILAEAPQQGSAAEKPLS
jgi:glucoamylase